MIRTSGSILRRAAIVLTLLAALGLLLLMVVVPRLGGATAYTVLTGSMEPTLPPGTLVVVRPTAFDQIDAGEVVTFQLRPDEPAVVTHRVIGRTVDAQGRPALLTKGDANNTPDAGVVIAAQVRGTPWYSVPVLGRLNIAFVEQRALAATVVAVGLLVYTALLVVSGLRDRRTRRDASDAISVGPGAP